MIKFPKQIKHYKLGNELGRGNFSVVCIATDLNSDQSSNQQNPDIENHQKSQNFKNYACKIFPKSNLQEPGDKERFQREISTMSRFHHPSLVSMHDFFSDDKNFYMILDLCEGGELYDYIVNHEKLDEVTSSLIFSQIVDAIGYCHSLGIAHRDLKPENILITDFPHIKISDFGLCGLISETKLMTSFCGSPCYCSPECLSKLDYDGRKSDIWSLGVLLYTMVTGQIPWNIMNTKMMLEQICTGTYPLTDDLSAECRDLISHLLVVQPNDRLTIEQIKNHPFTQKGNFSVYQYNQPLVNRALPSSKDALLQGFSNSQLVLQPHQRHHHDKTKLISSSESNEKYRFSGSILSPLGTSPFNTPKSALNIPKGISSNPPTVPTNSNSSRTESRQIQLSINFANSRFLIGKRRNTVGNAQTSISSLVIQPTKLPPLS